MPRIIGEDEVAISIRPNSQKARLDTLLQNTVVGDESSKAAIINFFGFNPVSASDEWTEEPITIQRTRISHKLHFKEFVRDQYPLIAESLGLPSADPNDPLNYDDVSALCSRLKAYITYWATCTKGRAADGKCCVSSLQQVAKHLVKIVILHVENDAQLKSIKEGEEMMDNVMRHDVTGKSGVVKQVFFHSAWLATELKLPLKAREMEANYGRFEAELILEDMKKFLFSGYRDPEDIMQRMILVLFAFSLGLRIGSMVASTAQDDQQLGMAQKDVRFDRLGHGLFTTHLKIRHLKGYNSVFKRRHVDAMMPPLQNADNVHLEPTALLLVLLIRRGALREDGPHGRLIKTVDELLASKAGRLIGVGDEPLFRKWVVDEPEPVPLDVTRATKYMGTHTKNVGLPSAGFHNFRRDFAAATATAMGDDVARLLLCHFKKGDSLNTHYTGGMRNHNLLAFRCGESKDHQAMAKLDASTIRHQTLTGLAVRLIAGKLDIGLDGESLLPGQRRKKMATHRKPEEIDERLAEEDSAYATLINRITGLSDLLFSATQIRISPNQSFNHSVSKIRSKLADHPPEVKEQLDQIVVARKAQLDYKKKTSLYNKADAPVKEVATGSTTNMERAQEMLSNKSYLPMSVASTSRLTGEHYTAGSNVSEKSRHNEQDSGKAVLAALTQLKQSGRLSDVDTSDKPMHQDDFDQEYVFTDTKEQSHADSMELTAVDVRLVWIKLFDKVWDAPAALVKLFTFMRRSGHCPICPFEATGSNKAVSTNRHPIVGLFEVIPATIELSNDDLSICRDHLRKYHPVELAALCTGDRLSIGTAQSPFNPVWAPHPIFERYPDIARQYYAPLSELQKTTSQKKLVAKWASVPAFQHPVNVEEKQAAMRILRKVLNRTPLNDPNRTTVKTIDGLMYTHDYYRKKNGWKRVKFGTRLQYLPSPVTINGRPSQPKWYNSNLPTFVCHYNTETIITPSKYTFRFHPYKKI